MLSLFFCYFLVRFSQDFSTNNVISKQSRFNVQRHDVHAHTFPTKNTTPQCKDEYWLDQVDAMKDARIQEVADQIDKRPYELQNCY